MLGRRVAVPVARLAGILALLASGCGGDDGSGEAGKTRQAQRPVDPARFSRTVDHRLVPLSSVRLTVFEGSEGGSQVRVESRVLDETERVAGVPVAVVEVQEYEGGELVEHTHDYYAQREDGSVWYFGERINDYQDGKIVGHKGQWLAGQGNAKPGLFMPADPAVGDHFEQERAPGVAEDRSTVVALGLDVRTPAGRFSDCTKTRDVAPLDKITEFKLYCPGVGLVREDPPEGRMQLVRYR
jgi:hypothetical protein